MALLEPGYEKTALKSQALWFGFWAVLTTIGAFLKPDSSGHGTHQQLGLPPCPSVLLFDRPCPGCGLTTSWTALIHGNVQLAFHVHPLGPPLYALFTISAFLALFGWVKGRRFSTDSVVFNRIMFVIVAVFLCFGLTRMAITPHFATTREHWFFYR